MNGFGEGLLLAGLVAFCVFIGYLFGTNSWQADCEVVGAIRSADKVYECKLKERAK